MPLRSCSTLVISLGETFPVATRLQSSSVDRVARLIDILHTPWGLGYATWGWVLPAVRCGAVPCLAWATTVDSTDAPILPAVVRLTTHLARGNWSAWLTFSTEREKISEFAVDTSADTKPPDGVSSM